MIPSIAELISLIEYCFEQGLTQSEIMLRLNCPRKWYFRYLLRLKKQGTFSWSLLYGQAIHAQLESYYQQLQTSTPKDQIQLPPIKFEFEPDIILTPRQKEEEEYWVSIAQMTIARYVDYYYEIDRKLHIVATEQQVAVQYRGFLLQGKIDLQFQRHINSSGIFLLDHKTVKEYSRSQYEGWNFKFQFIFYAWLLWQATGVQPLGILCNGIRKPSFRRRQSETLKSLLQRIEQDLIEQPETYFQRERLTFTANTLERFEQDTLRPVIFHFATILGIVHLSSEECDDSDFLDTIKSILITPNTDHCQIYNHPCEFLDLCSNAFQDHASEYIAQPHKHAELSK